MTTPTQQDLLLAKLMEERRELQLACGVVKSAIALGLSDPQELTALQRKLATIEEKISLRESQNRELALRRKPCFKFSEALLQSSASNPWHPTEMRT